MTTSSNTQQAFWIALGGLFSFGFSLVSAMILSRYFSKEDYGTYRQVLYVYTTLLTVFSLGLPKAFSYFLPRVKEEESKDLIKKITNLFYVLGLFFSLLLFFGSSYIGLFLKNPQLESALKFFSPVPFFMLPTLGLEGILATFRMTKFMTIYTVVTRLLMLLLIVLPVIFWDGDYVLAIQGFVVASFLSFLLALYFKFYPVKNKGMEKTSIRYSQIFEFSLPLLLASLWGILIKSTDQFFISRYFGTEVFADFANGNLDLPFVAMIVGATATVLSPIFSKMNHGQINPKEIYPLWISAYKKSALLIYPLLFFTLFYADTLMVLLYGKKYESSALFFQIYNLRNFFTIIVFAPLIINIGEVKFYQNAHLLSFILLVLINYVALYFFDSPYSISIASTAVTILIVFIFLNFIKKYFQVKFYHLFPFRTIFQMTIISMITLILSRLVLRNLESEIFKVTLGFVIYSISYGTISYLLKIDYYQLIKPIINERKS